MFDKMIKKLPRKARFKIGQLSIVLEKKLIGSEPVSIHEVVKVVTYDGGQELLELKRHFIEVQKEINQFQQDYLRMLDLTERMFNEIKIAIKDNPTHEQMFDVMKRYAFLIEEKDKRIFHSWKQIKKSMQKL